MSYAGFVADEGSQDLGGTLAFSTGEPATGYAPAGQYKIIPGGLTSNNYAITFVPGTLKVSKAQSSASATFSGTVRYSGRR